MFEEELAAIVAAAPTTIIVAEWDRLRSPEYVQALASALVAKGMSRQQTLNWLLPLLAAHATNGGEIYEIIDGKRHRISVTIDMEDRIFGIDDSKAWCTNVKRFAHRKPLRRVKETKALRLRLQMFDAAFWIIDKPIQID